MAFDALEARTVYLRMNPSFNKFCSSTIFVAFKTQMLKHLNVPLELFFDPQRTM